MPAVIAQGSGNVVGKNAELQVLAERLANTGPGVATVAPCPSNSLLLIGRKQAYRGPYGGANGALRKECPRNPPKRPGHTDSKLDFGGTVWSDGQDFCEEF